MATTRLGCVYCDGVLLENVKSQHSSGLPVEAVFVNPVIFNQISIPTATRSVPTAQDPIVTTRVEKAAAAILAPLPTAPDPAYVTAMQELNFNAFISALANTSSLTPSEKKEVTKFMQKHRHELHAVVSVRDVRKEDVPNFEVVQIEGKPIYTIRYGDTSGFIEDFKIYELRVNPSDSHSEVIGFAKVGKKVEAKDIDDFVSKRDKGQIEIIYIKVDEKFREKGFAYILLHKAITDVISTGATVQLLDQSDFKGTRLYQRVGDFEDDLGQTRAEFGHFSNIFNEYRYFPKSTSP